MKQRSSWNKGLIGFSAGDRNPGWMGGISKEKYSLDLTYEVKLEIRKRDGFICQLCGRTEEDELSQIGRSLCVNHIDFNKKNSSERNLITLCVRCNCSINFDREVSKKFLIKKIELIKPSYKAINLLSKWKPRKSIEERLWEKVDRSQFSPGGCWIWKASTNQSNASGGYGSFWSGRKLESAHVVSFRLNGGILSSDKPFVLHMCNISLCVNPVHLYAGDINQNAKDAIRAGTHQSVVLKNKTHCPYGHELLADNIVMFEFISRGARKCRKCANVRTKNNYQKHRV